MDVQVVLAFEKCKEILYSKKIIDKNVNEIEREGLFIFLVVLITYILSCVDFVSEQEYHDLQGFKNIEGLIKYIRDACCHVESDKNKKSKTFNRFNIYLGNIDINGRYSDDATIYYGKKYILYWRHIVLLFSELCRICCIGFEVDNTCESKMISS